MTAEEALAAAASALKERGSRHFQIALAGYLLDGRPYPADGLAVNATNTPNFVATETGFACEGFFPPAILDAQTVSTQPVLRSASGVEMMRVRIDVDSRDVWAIAEFICLSGSSHSRRNLQCAVRIAAAFRRPMPNSA
jgi:hypothetical protein